MYTQVDKSLTTHADHGDPVIDLRVDRSTSVKTRLIASLRHELGVAPYT